MGKPNKPSPKEAPPKTQKSAAEAASKQAQKEGGDKAPEAKAKCANTCAALLEKHQKEIGNAKNNFTEDQKYDVKQFQKNWTKNQAKYEAVSKQTGIPPKLIAAIHFRERDADFGTYLHQGDPLGVKAENEPSKIPIFQKDQWEEAAVHALNYDKHKKACQKELGIDENTTDQAKLAAYAERWNGFGYHERGIANPYVYSGTTNYTMGKYIKDGPGGFRPTFVDKQLGVIPLMNSVP